MGEVIVIVSVIFPVNSHLARIECLSHDSHEEGRRTLEVLQQMRGKDRDLSEPAIGMDLIFEIAIFLCIHRKTASKS